MRPSISLLAVLLAFAAAAAESPPDEKQPAADVPVTQPAKTTGATEKKPAPATNTKQQQSAPQPVDESTDVFKPSENVSEDIAVPYPSDI